MPRQFDSYGYNRQFKNKPVSRRDPFPRDRLPFIDDMSVLSELHSITNPKTNVANSTIDEANFKTPPNTRPSSPAGDTPGTLPYDKYAKTIHAGLENIKGTVNWREIAHDIEQAFEVIMATAEGGAAGLSSTGNVLGGAGGAVIAGVEKAHELHEQAKLAAKMKAIQETRLKWNERDRARDVAYSNNKFIGEYHFESP